MKKLFVLLCLLTFVPVCVFAEEDQHAYAHELFSALSTDKLLALKNLAEIELECREDCNNDNQSSGSSENEVFFLDETLTRDLLCDFFENFGLKIKRVLFQPLVEKDHGGLYGGKERWFVTLENGEQFPVWTANGLIDFIYDGEWYENIAIYP